MYSMVTIIVNKTVLCIWKLLRENLQIFILRQKFLLLCLVIDVNSNYCGDHPQYIQILNHYIVHLKPIFIVYVMLILCYYVNYVDMLYVNILIC